MLLLNLLVALANFWIWKVFKDNWLMGIVLISISFLLFFLVIKFNKIICILILILSLFLCGQIVTSGFDKNLTTLTVDGQKQLDTRHGYFSLELGKLFQNKYSLHFYKDFYPYLSSYENNVFNALNPNLYFFENHPREKGSVGEFPKYPGIFILPFMVGFLFLFKSAPKFVVIYFLSVLFITGFIRQGYSLGPILFYPLINFLITDGSIRIYKIFRK